jgi:TRAP-type uncharacterized transport system fused permease subunit
VLAVLRSTSFSSSIHLLPQWIIRAVQEGAVASVPTVRANVKSAHHVTERWTGRPQKRNKLLDALFAIVRALWHAQSNTWVREVSVRAVSATSIHRVSIGALSVMELSRRAVGDRRALVVSVTCTNKRERFFISRVSCPFFTLAYFEPT